MNLPTIDLSNLTDLDKLTAALGSFAHPAQAMSSDDSIAVLMAFIYEVLMRF